MTNPDITKAAEEAAYKIDQLLSASAEFDVLDVIAKSFSGFVSKEAVLALAEKIKAEPEPPYPTIAGLQRGVESYSLHDTWQARRNVAYELEKLVKDA